MFKILRDFFCCCLPCCRQPETPKTSETPKTAKKRKPKTCEYEDPRGILQLGYAIGEGANSLVCKGRYLENNETVAIKVMDAEKANNKEIKNEIKLLQKYTEHKNIATFRGVYLTPVPKGREKLWIAMEYCGGGNIAELISRTTYRAFPEPWIAYIIREVLRALNYLHTQGVIHRNIKGLNVALTEDARVRLTMHSVVPDEVCKRILYDDPPTLRSPSNWSTKFNSFLGRCLQKDPKLRPSARQLLKDPFVKNLQNVKTVRAEIQDLISKIDKAMNAEFTKSESSSES
eukprot:XP_017950390.1 PREDICTED: traf2 and NCK-interacting protein kinase-like [Xenopus tropicalis]